MKDLGLLEKVQKQPLNHCLTLLFLKISRGCFVIRLRILRLRFRRGRM